MSVDGGFDIHPDMRDLLDAKQAAKQADDARGGWDNYAAAMQRDRPADMIVRDTALPCAIDGPRAGRTRAHLSFCRSLRRRHA